MRIRCFTLFRIHKYSINFLYYNFIQFIILLYTFLVISFAWYQEYIICRISFEKFSDVLPAFTCARAIGNLWSICLGVKILRSSPCFFVCNLGYDSRIIIKQSHNFFLWFVKCFNFTYCTFLIFWFFTSFHYFL